jgi:hypothetical protein
MTKHYFSRYTYWCAPMLLALCTASAAQSTDTPSASADRAADPQAKVPAVSYRSVFKETSLGVEKDTRDWRKANDEVGKFTRGHIDILKWEEQESAKALKSNTDKSTVPPTGAQPPANTTATQPNATKPSAAPAHKH